MSIGEAIKAARYSGLSSASKVPRCTRRTTLAAMSGAVRSNSAKLSRLETPELTMAFERESPDADAMVGTSDALPYSRNFVGPVTRASLRRGTHCSGVQCSQGHGSTFLNRRTSAMQQAKNSSCTRAPNCGIPLGFP